MFRNGGVSLLSCILALLLLSALLLFASNSFTSLHSHAISKSLQSILISEINYARSLALTHYSKVTLCPTTAGVACESSWSDGQLIIMDDKPMRVFQQKAKGMLTYKGFGSSPYLVFDAAGINFATNGTFAYVDPTGNKTLWRLVINKAGRVRVDS